MISSGGKQKEYAQVGRESRATAGFAPPKTPDKRDQMAKNWHDAVWRIFPMDVLGQGRRARGRADADGPRRLLRGEEAVGWIELAKLEPARSGVGGSAMTPPPADIYARTEHTVGWVKLNAGTQLIADAQKLIAAP